jgi:hypothetical protein
VLERQLFSPEDRRDYGVRLLPAARQDTCALRYIRLTRRAATSHRRIERRRTRALDPLETFVTVRYSSNGCLAVDRTAFQKFCEEYRREVAIGVLVHGTLISNHRHWHCHLNSTCALKVGIHRGPPILFLWVDRGGVQVSSCLQI